MPRRKKSTKKQLMGGPIEDTIKGLISGIINRGGKKKKATRKTKAYPVSPTVGGSYSMPRKTVQKVSMKKYKSPRVAM